MAEIPKIVSQRLQAIATLGEHPDANLLGAFAERALTRREQVEMLEHLAGCSTCREIVSLSVTQPRVADASASAVPVNPGRIFWPVLRWGAALACVMVIGAAVTLHERRESQEVATAAQGKSAAEVNLPAPSSIAEKKGASLPVPASGAKTAFAANGQKPIIGNRSEASHIAADSKAVEMADARSASPFLDAVPGRAKDAQAEPQGAQAEKATGGSLSKNRFVAAPAGAANLAGDALLPANLVPRWTLNSDGTLQRSLDSGRSWQTIPVANQTRFRALAANGLDIWVGGAAGALFHSSDAGQHWTQVRPVANGEPLADDIIGVEFTDTLHGKLTSSLEETWVTTDAGQTWEKQ
jgi:hypothetical protein